MRAGRPGDHRSPPRCRRREPARSARWRFGDAPFDIAVNPTLGNALRRTGLDEFGLAGEDVRVHEKEQLTGCATVLLLDISHSMILYGRIASRPRRTWRSRSWSSCARVTRRTRSTWPCSATTPCPFRADRIPYVQVGPYHTNTKAALRLAQQDPRHAQASNKQVFLVTDGKPSAIHEEGRLYKNSFGLDEKIVNKTLDEATVCRRRGITISTFMVASDWHLVNFVERLTEVNHGRAYFTGLDDLGRFLFVDYVRNRRRRTY